jgi:hypothetical protein
VQDESNTNSPQGRGTYIMNKFAVNGSCCLVVLYSKTDIRMLQFVIDNIFAMLSEHVFRARRCRDSMVVGFTITHAINAYTTNVVS